MGGLEEICKIKMTISILFREDQFAIESYPLGPLKKIRIGHDNSLVGAGWFLDKVRFQSLNTLFVEAVSRSKLHLYN